MKVLITGGTGFIGSHLVRSLVQKGHTVVVLSRRNSSLEKIEDIIKKISVVRYSYIEDIPQIIKHISPFDGVVHFTAKYVKWSPTPEDIREMNDVNITLPSLILFALHEGQFFLNTGTCFEYTLSKKKLTESSPQVPYNYYAATKRSFEEILKYFSHKKHIHGMTLKLFYPYGPHDNKKVIQIMIEALKTGHPVEFSLGEQKLNYTYVGDIIGAYEKALDLLRSNDYKGYDYINIGRSEVTSLKEIGIYLEKISGKKGLLQFTKPYPEGEILFMNCDASKAKKVLGWEAKIDIEEGLQRTYNSSTL